jgi:hypothetical protein
MGSCECRKAENTEAKKKKMDALLKLGTCGGRLRHERKRREAEQREDEISALRTSTRICGASADPKASCWNIAPFSRILLYPSDMPYTVR